VRMVWVCSWELVLDRVEGERWETRMNKFVRGREGVEWKTIWYESKKP